MKQLLKIILLLCVALAPLPAAAESSTSKAASAASAPESPTWLRQAGKSSAPAAMEGISPWRIVLVLLTLAGLITVVWFTRKPQGRSQRGQAPDMRVVGSTRIGPKAQAVVAEINGQLFLLGVTESSVTRLADLSAPAAGGPASQKPRTAASAYEAAEPSSSVDRIPLNGFGRFAEMLEGALDSTPRASSASELAAESTEDVVSTRSTLKSARRPLRWNLDEQASGLVAHMNSRP